MIKPKPKRGRKPLYPWTEWFGDRGTVNRLVRGKHFHCAPHGFAQAARKAASRLRISLSVRIQDDNGSSVVTLENRGTTKVRISERRKEREDE